MTRKKQMHLITRPFSHVHNILTALGFAERAQRDGCVYEIMFRDPITLKDYLYQLPAQTATNGLTIVHLHKACFKDGGDIPLSAIEAAAQMMAEVEQYLASHEPKEAGKPIEEAMNGRMANNEEEVKRLGKEMASMPTNSQVMKSGLVPDPIQ
ncbi:hypothetical protein GCM10023310_08830 [Paenibacillus vulneris]|uniref:Uncharacterized protein n=1 Tax=Paenibacillus vulneris TaxID=1133364 RepID=A0ABW3UVG5_9BACL|nr:MULTISPECIES: hypothetical protein [unclassified Paenibacillus]MBE1443589.1 hypothetical protein [Paenibacillus sp. OAS669]